jgi:hypothetical protein
LGIQVQEVGFEVGSLEKVHTSNQRSGLLYVLLISSAFALSTFAIKGNHF